MEKCQSFAVAKGVQCWGSMTGTGKVLSAFRKNSLCFVLLHHDLRAFLLEVDVKSDFLYQEHSAVYFLRLKLQCTLPPRNSEVCTHKGWLLLRIKVGQLFIVMFKGDKGDRKERPGLS